MTHPELRATPDWHSTGDNYFPLAASVDGSWWVLRLNNYPDHPLLTLFVDGARRFDIDDTPPSWGELSPDTAPPLDTAHEILAPIKHFTAYGSEVGQPCDNLFCCG